MERAIAIADKNFDGSLPRDIRLVDYGEIGNAVAIEIALRDGVEVSACCVIGVTSEAAARNSSHRLRDSQRSAGEVIRVTAVVRCQRAAGGSEEPRGKLKALPVHQWTAAEERGSVEKNFPQSRWLRTALPSR